MLEVTVCKFISELYKLDNNQLRVLLGLTRSITNCGAATYCLIKGS